MATNEEYQALIDSLSGECERLHKENEELKKALENHDTFMKYAYSQGKQDALSKEPCRNGEMRNEKTPTNHGCFSEISKKISNSLL